MASSDTTALPKNAARSPKWSPSRPTPRMVTSCIRKLIAVDEVPADDGHDLAGCELFFGGLGEGEGV